MNKAQATVPSRIRVLLIYNKIIPSIRLCGYSQLEELSKQNLVDFEAIRYINVQRSNLNWADVVIFGRSDSWYECILARHAQKAGKHIAYILDDDLLNVPQYLSSAAYLNRKDIRRNIQELILLSDIIISPSPVLLSKYAGDGSGRMGLLTEEPAIDPVSYVPHGASQPIRIGFAGSIDRTQDIENILKDALVKIKAEYGNMVQFSFFGAIPSFAQELDAQIIPYSESYEDYRKTLNRLAWDIGLAPMPQTAFHSCKHYNKFVEYAASGVAGIYSETDPYRRLKAWDRIGLFCTNTSSSWYHAMKQLIENRSKVEQIRQQVCVLTQKELSIQTVSNHFFQQLQQCTSQKKSCKHTFYTLAPYKIIHFLLRGYHFLSSHRRELIPAIHEKLRSRYFC